MADFYGGDLSEGESLDAFLSRYRNAQIDSEPWRDWVSERRWLEEPSAALNEFIAERAPQPQQLTCPRVFVSHRQHDVGHAKRVAYLANQQGFEFWLDVFDPKLQGLAAASPLPAAAHAALIASIIEMALLNCTHVIGVLTKQTRGTLWVPYEYGRVKERRLTSQRVAVWLHPNIIAADIPEYTVLGETTQTEAEIGAWFASELTAWAGQTNRCSGGAGNRWSGGATKRLPI